MAYLAFLLCFLWHFSDDDYFVLYCLFLLPLALEELFPRRLFLVLVLEDAAKLVEDAVAAEDDAAVVVEEGAVVVVLRALVVRLVVVVKLRL